MIQYIIKKICSLFAVLIGISVLAFLLGAFSPGDPAELALSKGGIYQPDSAQIEQMRIKMGLNKPLFIQYLHWLKKIVQGNIGISYATDEPISQVFARRIPITLNLALYSFFLTIVIGLCTGIIASAYKDRFIDHLIMAFVNIMLSLPAFWIALLFILLFSEKLMILPTSGYGGLAHMIMPASVLSIASIATIARLMRASMLEEFGKFYYTTGIASGIPKIRMMYYHILRNAVIPVLPLIGSFTGAILGGSAIVETIFALPGLGSFVVESIGVKDIPVIQIYVLFTGTVYVTITSAVDVLSAFLNPKLRVVIQNE